MLTKTALNPLDFALSVAGSAFFSTFLPGGYTYSARSVNLSKDMSLGDTAESRDSSLVLGLAEKAEGDCTVTKANDSADLALRTHTPPSSLPISRIIILVVI